MRPEPEDPSHSRNTSYLLVKGQQHPKRRSKMVGKLLMDYQWVYQEPTIIGIWDLNLNQHHIDQYFNFNLLMLLLCECLLRDSGGGFDLCELPFAWVAEAILSCRCPTCRHNVKFLNLGARDQVIPSAGGWAATGVIHSGSWLSQC